jgi:predicted DNA-binding transcriptional regulator YafY
VRASRLLSILILLQMRGRLSAEALAREFEVSVRTIYRDVDQLSAAGVPIYAERGRAGGFALLDGYRTKLTGFTSAEANALLLAGIGEAAADLGLGGELAAAQLKLLASLPPDSGASAERVATRFHLDPTAWYSRPESLDILPTLAASVWRERRIKVRYESWKGVVDRTLDPLGLVLKGGAWYLVAAARGQPRTYRVSNIHALETTETPCQRPPRFALARYWTKWAREFEERLLSERATIEISEAGRKLMRDVNPIAAQAIAASQRPSARAGWVRADIPVEGPDYAARQLLRLGADVQVIAPRALRQAVAAEAKRVAGLYA